MSKTRVDDRSLNMDRRRFLIKTLGLGAAGLAAGGAAAWAKGELDKAGTGAVTASASLPDLQVQLDQVTAAKAALELSHSTLQAQANEWQRQLQAATSQNAQLSSSLTAAQQELANLQAQLGSSQTALQGANTRMTLLQNLVGLFDQLDGIGLDTVVANGLPAVAGALAGVMGPSALLRTGIDSARGLLSTFENTLPDFNAAMQWLGDQVVRLKVGLWGVEVSTQELVTSAAAGIAAAFGGFGGFVLDHLPFDIGKRVRGTLTATQTVLAGLATMTDSAADQVLLKISKYVDGGAQDWKNTLVSPLRDSTLAVADQVLSAVTNADSAYQQSLHSPAQAALQQRQALREQISSFRASNSL